MELDKASRPTTSLARAGVLAHHEFMVPLKKINDGDDLDFFFTSTAYRSLTTWLLQLTRSMFPRKNDDGTSTICSLAQPPVLSSNIQKLQLLLETLTSFIEQAPPDTGPRRFGNVAFRKWFQIAEEKSSGLLKDYLVETSLVSALSPAQEIALCDELKSYLLGGFGSAPRLDYGTGHELSFLAFLGCLWKLGVFQDGEEQAIVVGIIQPYLTLVRKLILTYTLEPAGSHGVWGLDDHSFLPYIFGSAQLGPAISPADHTAPIPVEGSIRSAPSPALVADKAAVAGYKDSNMYFSAIQFINDVKTGPFWEHSPVLYDISGIKDGWGKINKGMLKMYAAEVLGKFPVVQHFPFGSMFQWERDPEAAAAPSTFHAQQQPSVTKSHDMPPATTPSAGGSGTTAPWAKSSAGATQVPTQMPQMQAATGLPTTRAPWAGRSNADPRTSMPAPSQRRPHPAEGRNTRPQ